METTIILGDGTEYKEGQPLWCVGKWFDSSRSTDWFPVKRTPISYSDDKFTFKFNPKIVIMRREAATFCYATEEACQAECDKANGVMK